MNDKQGIIIGILVTIAVLLSLAIYIGNAGTITDTELVVPIIMIILVLAASLILWDRAKNVRKGLPSKDERLINVNYRAGYYAFIAAIWSAFGGPALTDIIFGYELEGHHVTTIVVLVSGFVFVASYLYMAWKGNTQ